jgi:predicted TIM-barrel fold metal-dependent hydrolase
MVIDVHAHLYLGPPMIYWASPPLGLSLCRVYNHEIAKVARAHPDQFVGFAAIPLQAACCDVVARPAVDLVREVGIARTCTATQSTTPTWHIFKQVQMVDMPILIHHIIRSANPTSTTGSTSSSSFRITTHRKRVTKFVREEPCRVTRQRPGGPEFLISRCFRSTWVG